MLNTKLNLYNPDWIELVFTDRNKKYGAFELRQHYGVTMIKAMAIAFTTVVAAATLYTYIVGKTPVEIIITKEYDIPIIPPTIVQPKKIEPPVKASAPAKEMPPAKTTQFIIPTPTLNPVTVDPPKSTELTGEVGPKTIEGKGTIAPIVDPASTTGGTGVVAPAEDKSIHDVSTLEFMPEPIGGTSAWNKFLSKNLRFPSQAQEEGKGGRVLVSFVIEKDGRLSDISIQRGAGYGMDEEALRVLKLAKPWKPGMQNGQPVRVRYVIPMYFKMGEEQ